MSYNYYKNSSDLTDPLKESAHEQPLILLVEGGPGSEWVCLRFDFMQERFHNTSPGDLEGMFIKAGDSGTRTGLG